MQGNPRFASLVHEELLSVFKSERCAFCCRLIIETPSFQIQLAALSLCSGDRGKLATAQTLRFLLSAPSDNESEPFVPGATSILFDSLGAAPF